MIEDVQVSMPESSLPEACWPSPTLPGKGPVSFTSVSLQCELLPQGGGETAGSLSLFAFDANGRKTICDSISF